MQATCSIWRKNFAITSRCIAGLAELLFTLLIFCKASTSRVISYVIVSFFFINFSEATEKLSIASVDFRIWKWTVRATFLIVILGITLDALRVYCNENEFPLNLFGRLMIVWIIETENRYLLAHISLLLLAFVSFDDDSQHNHSHDTDAADVFATKASISNFFEFFPSFENFTIWYWKYWNNPK